MWYFVLDPQPPFPYTDLTQKRVLINSININKMGKMEDYEFNKVAHYKNVQVVGYTELDGKPVLKIDIS